jgi:Na+-driven multidrug efflux pump
MLSRTLMSLVLMRIVAACGTSAVAAYGIGTRFHMILLMPSFALGNSAATLVGQNLGAGKPARANTAAWLATGIGMAIMAVSALALYLWAPQLVRCFDGNPAVVSIGSTFLRIASPFYVFASMGIILGRALIGAGDSMGPMITTIAGLWGVQVPLAILLPRLVTPPTSGIWWSVAAALAVNGALTTAWFQTGRWRAKRLG